MYVDILCLEIVLSLAKEYVEGSFVGRDGDSPLVTRED